MQETTTIGLDIAKSVFQVHVVDAASNVIVCRQFKRRYVLAFFLRVGWFRYAAVRVCALVLPSHVRRSAVLKTSCAPR